MAKSLHQQIEDLVSRLSPTVREAFLAAIEDVQDTVILTDLIKAIEAKDYQQAFRTLGMSNASMRPLTAAIEQVFETGGGVVANSFPAVVATGYGRGVFRFDVRAPSAEKWLKEQSSGLVTRIQEDARVNIMNVMSVGLQEGNNPRQTALDIVGRINPTTGRREGGIIGLAQNQELWVRNARQDLMTGNYANYLNRSRRDKRFDSVVQKALADGQPLPKETIDKLISRYKDSLLQLRGENIARTETIQSLNRAQHEAVNQAIEAGAIKESAAKREWDTAGDDRVRDTHAEMDGQLVGWNEPFKTPDGYQLMFPGDSALGAPASETINCRCRTKLRLDFLANID